MATAAPLSGTQNLSRPALLMTTASAGLRLKLLLFTAHFRSLRTFPSNLSNVHGLSCTGKRHLLDGPAGARVRATASASQLKDEWLDSLSCPFSERIGPPIARDELHGAPDSGWVLGIDPDVSGALALLKADGSAQVFDTPHLQVLVGKRIRKRLDTRSIVQLLHGCGAPLGTTAYIEQSTPFPKDGKQVESQVARLGTCAVKFLGGLLCDGWWSGGYTYGLWIGILVASGYSVVPVSSRLWKDHFELSRNPSSKVIRTKAEEFFEGSKANSFCTKDDSREAASNLFPSLSSQLKRKKDHGRAEALLIAAYGKGLRIQSDLIAT